MVAVVEIACSKGATWPLLAVFQNKGSGVGQKRRINGVRATSAQRSTAALQQPAQQAISGIEEQSSTARHALPSCCPTGFELTLQQLDRRRHRAKFSMSFLDLRT